MVRIRMRRSTVGILVLALACTPGPGGEAGSTGESARGGDGTDGAVATGRVAADTEVADPERPSAAQAVAARPPAGHAFVIFGADTVVAELAISADERAEGLMYRDELPDGTGMLFVYPDSDVRAFWMRNTYVDLDLAYMDPGFTVVDLQEREAMDSTSVPSAAPAMYVLEVRRGWFAEHGLGVGSQAIVEFGTAPRR